MTPIARVRFMLGDTVLFDGHSLIPRLGEVWSFGDRDYRVMVIHRRFERLGMKLRRVAVVDLREIEK